MLSVHSECGAYLLSVNALPSLLQKEGWYQFIILGRWKAWLATSPPELI